MPWQAGQAKNPGTTQGLLLSTGWRAGGSRTLDNTTAHPRVVVSGKLRHGSPRDVCPVALNHPPVQQANVGRVERASQQPRYRLEVGQQISAVRIQAPH